MKNAPRIDPPTASENRRLTPAEIAIAVKYRRKQVGMKQVTLANIAGVVERTVQRLENGQKVDDQTLGEIAKALGLSERTFLTNAPVPGIDLPTGGFEIVGRRAQEKLNGPAMMKKHFQEMIAFDRWANQAILNWMETHPEDPEITRVFAHVIAENLPWMYVMKGETVPSDIDPEPNWALTECRDRFEPTMNALASFVADLDEEDFENIVHSASPAGMVFENTVTEVIANLLSHAEHHRGQIVSRIAKEHGEYLPTSYMSYLRCRG